VGKVSYFVLIEVDTFRGLGVLTQHADQNVIFLEYNSWHRTIVWQTVIGYWVLDTGYWPSVENHCLNSPLASFENVPMSLTSAPTWRVLYVLKFLECL